MDRREEERERGGIARGNVLYVGISLVIPRVCGRARRRISFSEISRHFAGSDCAGIQFICKNEKI